MSTIFVRNNNCRWSAGRSRDQLLLRTIYIFNRNSRCSLYM